jgi:hypothetical protein
MIVANEISYEVIHIENHWKCVVWLTLGPMADENATMLHITDLHREG